MSQADVYDLTREALWTLLIISAPPLLVALFLGLAIALLQALTQIQEATLTFVPKMVAMVLVLMLALPLMGGRMGALMDNIVDRIANG